MKSTDNVLFCDNHVLAWIKAPGMPTQTHREGQVSAEALAKKWIKHTFHKPGQVFLHPIHRLDQQVGGIVLFARTSKALSRLQEQMRERTLVKEYLAFVEGEMDPPEGVLEDYLEHGSFRSHLSQTGGKHAVLSYRVVEKKNDVSVVRISLQTGRYHQIRVQLASRGHPILGDVKYRSRKKWHKEGIALWHVKMVFTHPVTKERVTVELPSEDLLKETKR